MSPLAYASQAVDLVVAPADAIASRHASLALLDDAERLRHGRLRHQGDRARFVAGRVLVRELVGAACGIEPGLVCLVPDGRGRPRVVAPLAGPDVSIAHAEGLVAVAIGTTARVGVDIEPIRPVPDLERVALTARERAVVATLDDEARADRVLETWTAKEAYAKLVGHGLCLDFTRLSLARIAARRRIAFRTLVTAHGADRYRVTVASWSRVADGSARAARTAA